MRVMFAGLPIPAHLYALVPLARALQSAGHEVCVASHADLAGPITAAGLTAVPLGRRGSTPVLAAAPDFELDPETMRRLTAALAIEPEQRYLWEMFSSYLLPAMRVLHAPAAGGAIPVVDDLLAAARGFGPDLMLTDLWPAAAVAARVCGAAHARALWGPDYAGWVVHRCARRRRELAAAGVENPLLAVVRPAAQRNGVEVDDRLLLGDWTVDPTPPELRAPVPDGRTVPVRRVPFTGAGVLPDWLYPPPERPRVALTLGTSAREYWSDAAMVGAMLELVAELDIEVVATLNGVQLAGLAVPDNVRTVSYLPLTELLPTCAAVVHHGGGGTSAAAVAHRVPQLVELSGVEAGVYGPYLTRHRAGLTVDHARQSVPQLRDRLVRVLHRDEFRAGIGRLHADWLAAPAPNDVVPVLVRLTAAVRG